MRTGDAGREHSGALRLDCHHPYGGVLRFQILPDAGHGAARADTGDKNVYPSVGVLPDLGAGRLAVRLRVRRVHKLAGDKAVGNLRRQLVRFGDRPLHALSALGQHQLRAVRLHQLPPLHRHGVGHHDDDAVAPRRGDRRKPDAGVAGGRLNDDRAGLQPPVCLRVVEHRLGDAVLDRAGGIEIFQLRADRRLEVIKRFDVGQLQERGVTDQLICRGVNTGHVAHSFYILNK